MRVGRLRNGLTLLMLMVITLLAAEMGAAEQPNFIIILADDLGYGDLGCYGSKLIATPRLDRMAAEGMQFTDFYVASPFCSPSRAALLTGRLPARCGVPYVLFPSEHTGLPPEEITIAEMLKSVGYATACIGKWHLGWRRELRPQNQGFDEFFGVRHSNDADEWTSGRAFHQLSDFEPFSLRDGDLVVEVPVDQSLLTEKYTERALDFIRRNRDRQFFLYLPHTMPHVPQHASPAFAGKSKDNAYGDCIEELDASTGRILDLLDELHIADDTLVVFTSDNGAAVQNRAQRVPRNAAAERFPGHAFGGSNGILRMGKGSTWEGGVRVPCIVRQPGTIAAGRVEAMPCSTLDLLPTFAMLAGVAPTPNVTLDGMNISELLNTPGRTNLSARTLTHYFGLQLQSVRQGDWKHILPIAAPPKVRVESLWFVHQPQLFERQHRLWPTASLFHLPTDPGEQNDVAAAHPEIVASLLRQAVDFDKDFQATLRPVLRLPGPQPPAPGQVRTEADSIDEWQRLIMEPTTP